MQLLIHYGIYKTGSSFIQTICIRNKELLESSSIYFPESKYDERMLAGEISPGNSSGLTNILRKGDEVACRKLLDKWVKTAKQRNCDKILISDEALIHVFAIKDSLMLLKKIINDAGMSPVNCFAFFRNPVDHCISTFKHRAKRGTIDDFEAWVKHTYETMKVIDAFLKNYSNAGFNWSFRAYKKDGSELSNTFFKDWLSISVPENLKVASINPSLTLSELKVIQIARKDNEKKVPYLYHVFLKLPKRNKANDKIAEGQYKFIAATELIKYNSVLQALNSKLPPDENLIIESPNTFDEGKEKAVLSLSQEQVSAIFSAYNESMNIKSLTIDFLREVKRTLTFRNGPN